MFIKREIIDHLYDKGIRKYGIFCDNVLNFHGSDNCYYEEWLEDIIEDGGWICLVNTLEHVEREMVDTEIQHYVNFGEEFNDIDWRMKKPESLYIQLDQMVRAHSNRLSY